MKIQFLKAEENDVPEILEMMGEFNAIDNYPFDKARTKKNLIDLLGNQNLGRAWIIKKDGQYIGYIILGFGFSFEHNGRDAFIDELYLRPEFRHKGYGKLAMDFILEEVPILGINVIHLEVEQHNKGASILYRKKGFIDNGRILLSRKIGNQKDD
ncbi:MAG: GNAT family N-acetyltransferase [Gillisia sp.]